MKQRIKRISSMRGIGFCYSKASLTLQGTTTDNITTQQGSTTDNSSTQQGSAEDQLPAVSQYTTSEPIDTPEQYTSAQSIDTCDQYTNTDSKHTPDQYMTTDSIHTADQGTSTDTIHTVDQYMSTDSIHTAEQGTSTDSILTVDQETSTDTSILLDEGICDFISGLYGQKDDLQWQVDELTRALDRTNAERDRLSSDLQDALLQLDTLTEERGAARLEVQGLMQQREQVERLLHDLGNIFLRLNERIQNV